MRAGVSPYYHMRREWQLPTALAGSPHLSTHTHTHVLGREEDLTKLHDVRVPQLGVVYELALCVAQHQVCALQLLDGHLWCRTGGGGSTAVRGVAFACGARPAASAKEWLEAAELKPPDGTERMPLIRTCGCCCCCFDPAATRLLVRAHVPAQQDLPKRPGANVLHRQATPAPAATAKRVVGVRGMVTEPPPLVVR
jgi:hypothetical protein